MELTIASLKALRCAGRNSHSLYLLTLHRPSYFPNGFFSFFNGILIAVSKFLCELNFYFLWIQNLNFYKLRFEFSNFYVFQQNSGHVQIMQSKLVLQRSYPSFFLEFIGGFYAKRLRITTWLHQELFWKYFK